MASKSEMIDFIVENSDHDKNELESLSYKKVKTIFINTDEKEEVDFGFTKEIILTPSIIDGNAIIDALPSAEEIEVELEEEPKVKAKNDGTEPDFNESGEIQKKIIDKGIDIKSLSPVQKRAYARSGRIPKKK